MNKFSHPTKKLWAIATLLFLLVTVTAVVYAANITVDDFSTSTQTSLVTYFDGDPLPLLNCTYRSPASPSTLGGHRDVCIEVTGASTDGDIARLRVTTGQLALSADSSLSVRGFVQWDGTNATEVLDPTGLGGQDLTGGGTNDGILVRIINSDGVPIRITLRIYTNATNWAEQTIDLSTVIVAGTDVVDLFYLFADFVDQAGIMNPASVGAVEAEILSLSPGPDLNIDLIEATSIYDYGDLPDMYGTTLASNGARHLATTGLRLGNSVDAENDGVPNPSAVGDDSAYVITTLDDEGGVLRQPGLGGNGGWTNGTVSSGQGGRLDISITGGSGVPQVFMDFDGLGLVPVTLRNNVGTALTMPLVAGTYQAYFDIPAGTFDGTNNRSIPTRVRLSSAGGLSATGDAPDGEVEDYIYNFGPTAITFSRFAAEENTTWVAIAGAGLLALVSTGIVLYRRRQLVN